MNKKLIKEFHDKERELVSSLKHLNFNVNNYDSKASIEIANILKKNGYEAIGGGSYRAVYSRKDVPFVIKVGFSTAGMLSNKREALAASTTDKSQNIKSILPHLYSHDKNFAWAIFEKVIPLSRYVKDINKEYNNIAKVFPTFHRIFSNSNSYHYSPKSEHLYLMKDLISQTFYYIVNDGIKDHKLIINKIKYECRDSKDNVEEIISEEPMKDIKRFIEASSIDNTLDIPANNLGRRYSDNPSPKDIVILDFDDHPQYSKKVLPVKNKKDAKIINTNVDDYIKSKVNLKDLYNDWENWEPSEEDYDESYDDEEWDYPVPFDEWKEKEKNENITKNIYLKLLKEFHNKEQDIADKLKETEANPKSWSIYNDLYDVLKKEGYDIIGSGISRVVFSKIDVPFVIKLASYPNTGVSANKSEIKFSTKEDTSSQVSSIVPELYSYSENKNPMWIICEKVIPVEESSIENLIKSFPTLYYFAKQKTLNDGSIVERDLTKDEFLLLVKNVFFNITKKTNVNMNIALSIIERQCKLIYSEDYDLIKIRDTLPLLDIKRFIESTSYDYTMDLHLGNLGIRNEKTINHNSFFILDFDPKIGGSKKQIRHIFDDNPDHPNHPDRDAKLIGNIDNSKPPREPNWSAIMSAEVNAIDESVAEAVYKRLVIESSKQKRKYSGSHPDETYKYGWPEFDDAWFDADGKTTWDEDREWTKQYLKSIGLL